MEDHDTVVSIVTTDTCSFPSPPGPGQPPRGKTHASFPNAAENNARKSLRPAHEGVNLVILMDTTQKQFSLNRGASKTKFFQEEGRRVATAPRLLVVRQAGAITRRNNTLRKCRH